MLEHTLREMVLDAGQQRRRGGVERPEQPGYPLDLVVRAIIINDILKPGLPREPIPQDG